MKAKNLRIGDRIRITTVPGQGNPEFHIHRDTRRVYKLVLARKRPVRIYEIDEKGTPWFRVIETDKKGRRLYHCLAVYDQEKNWVLARSRTRV